MTASGGEPLLTSPARLQKIDQLRDNNIGSYIPLPQLVAVGDQSSGKSSLLESLSSIPFPRGQELCTRYATQISHRRESTQSIDITVVPGPHASDEHKKTLEAYSRTLQTTAQLRKAFPSILEKVNALMGIKTPNNPDGEHTFSEDVLKIEKCGPNEDYLTIIDVPGIFRNTTEGVTTDKDKELVKNMVNRYIKDDRTVILAVLPCNVDVATQEILALAKEVDPTGDRTLGILTKADLLIEQSAKISVAGLVEGKKKPLKLGYHIVTNRGGDDHTVEDDVVAAKSLRKREAIFQQKPWIRLPEDRVGVLSLRERLSEVLGEITDRAFPQLRRETIERWEKARDKLNNMGNSRESEREQRQYLVGIASNFQALARAALSADYAVHPAFEQDQLRLITTVASFSDKFHEDFMNHGHKYYFQSEKIPDPEQQVDVPDVAGCFTVPPPSRFPELSKTITNDWALVKPSEGVMPWIEGVNRRSRGLDLGTLGPGVISSVFNEQSEKWKLMTSQYISKVIILVHQFVTSSLKVVCADTQVVKNITSAIMGELSERYASAMSQAMLLVHVERQLKPYTLNPYFNHNQQRSCGDRIKKNLEKKAWEANNYNGQERSIVVALANVADAVVNKTNEDFTKDTIHDILEAYYKVAYKRFVDNIFKQAVDYKLLSGPDSPLTLFSEQWVLGLEADKLLAVAGESSRNRKMRDRLKREIHDLEIALDILL